MWAVAAGLIFLAACGRIGFDPSGDGGNGGGDGDGAGSGDAAAGPCPTDCVANALATHCFCAGPADSAVALAICTSVGRSLVRVDSAAENTSLRDFSEANGLAPNDPLIIGGTDEANEDDWRWRDGAPFWAGDFSGAPVGGSFTLWEVGQPNNNGGSEDCLAIDGVSRAWNDTECSRDLAFACE